MKKLGKHISPFLLLALPVFVFMVILAVHAGNELVFEKIQFSAAFFSVPKLDLFRAFLAF